MFILYLVKETFLGLDFYLTSFFFMHHRENAFGKKTLVVIISLPSRVQLFCITLQFRIKTYVFPHESPFCAIMSTDDAAPLTGLTKLNKRSTIDAGL